MGIAQIENNGAFCTKGGRGYNYNGQVGKKGERARGSTMCQRDCRSTGTTVAQHIRV